MLIAYVEFAIRRGENFAGPLFKPFCNSPERFREKRNIFPDFGLTFSVNRITLRLVSNHSMHLHWLITVVSNRLAEEEIYKL